MSLSKFFFFFLFTVTALVPLQAQEVAAVIKVPEALSRSARVLPKTKELVSSYRALSSVSGSSSLPKPFNPAITAPKLEAKVAKQVYASARQHFAGPSPLLDQAARGLVRVSPPRHSGVWGTGFLFVFQDKLFVVLPYHVGGQTGNTRTFWIFQEDGSRKEYTVPIVAHGNAGWHSLDVSLAQLPMEALDNGAVALKVGEVSIPQEAYSFGYTVGPFEQEDILPMERYLVSAEGYGLQDAKRQIFGENPDEPFSISGYCGAPILQLQQGEWKVVGMHVGSYAMPGEPEKNRSFAVNLSRALPLLLDNYLKGISVTRELSFRGWEVGRLEQERVQEIQVWRGKNLVFQREIRNYLGPYSDEHSEMALAGFDTSRGDLIRYIVVNNSRQMRQIDFVIP